METPVSPEEGKSHPDLNIYVGSLADYNNGRLHGIWLDASESADQLHAAVQTMLEHSPTGGAEEFAVFDFEGFGPWRPDEYESLETIAKVAGGIREFGPVFAHFVALRGTEEELTAAFEDAYLGHYDSLEAFAEELLEDVANLIQVPPELESYVHLDVEAYARDLELSGEIESSEGDGGVYLFHS